MYTAHLIACLQDLFFGGGGGGAGLWGEGEILDLVLANVATPFLPEHSECQSSTEYDDDHLTTSKKKKSLAFNGHKTHSKPGNQIPARHRS